MAGTHEGRVIIFPQLTEVLTPFETKPQAKKLLDADGGSITLMELAAGQSWHEHHSVHPVVVQVLKGIYLFLRRCALDLFNLNSDIRLRM